MKPKMRITLLNPDLISISDRLVDQEGELKAGPTDQHTNPYRLEVTLKDSGTIDQVIAYIEKLRGKLPIESPKDKTKTKKGEEVNPYQEIYKAIKEKEYIEDIITYLDEVNFRFISAQLLEEKGVNVNVPDYDLQEKLSSYQVMVKVLKYAKDPDNDKFDLNLCVFVKFIGNLSPKVFVYYKGEKKAGLVRKWRKTGSINMKKKKIPMVFPDYMTIEERKKWRYVRRKVELERPIGAKDQKFYDRYFSAIKNINEGKGFNL